MTGMTDDELELRLASAFRRGTLPAAPYGLGSVLERIPDEPVVAGGGNASRRRSAWGVLGLAAVLAVGGLLALVGGGRNPSLPVPSERPSVVAAGDSLVYRVEWTAEVPVSIPAMSNLIGIVQRRLEGTAAAGAQVTSNGSDQLVVDVPAGIDLDPIRRLIGQRGLVAFVPLGPAAVGAGEPIDQVKFPSLFQGDLVTDPVITTDGSGQPALQLRLVAPADGLFADYTASHIGDSFAITVDGLVVSAPRIMAAIPDGNVEISVGVDRDIESLRQLAAIIRSGALPVALVETATGPIEPSASAVAPVGPSDAPGSPTTTLSPNEPDITCEPPVPIPGPQMTCEQAVAAALELVPDAAGPLGRITFRHECVDVTGRGAQLDCAVQMFGLVSIELANGKTFVVQTSLGEPRPRVVAPFGGPPVFIALAAAGDSETCSGVESGSVTIRIDRSASEQVWAERSSGVRLPVRARGAITAEAEPFPMILDDQRHQVAHDGTSVSLGPALRIGTPICLSDQDGALLILGRLGL